MRVVGCGDAVFTTIRNVDIERHEWLGFQALADIGSHDENLSKSVAARKQGIITVFKMTCRRSAFVTTLTEERAIAAEAIMGFSSQPVRG